MTAYYALFELAHPRQQQTILVHSAAGAWAAFCPIGKLAGCKVVGVVGSHSQSRLCKKIGADAVIDKSSQDLWRSQTRGP